MTSDDIYYKHLHIWHDTKGQTQIDEQVIKVFV